MQKWEYMTLLHAWDEEEKVFYWDVDRADHATVDAKLKIAGQDSWELVAVRPFGLNSSAFYHFKRPAD